MENTAAPQQEKFDSQAGYEDAVDAVIAKAKKRIRIFDKQASPAFNSVKRYELLRNFLLASRDNRLYIVLHDAGFLTANCPRMLLLLRHFSHGIAIHETQQHAKHVYDPFTVIDDSHYAHRFHHENVRGLMAFNDSAGAHEFNDRFDEIWEASFLAVSATTLGLR
ncbi:MAG TPA: hypothetical protein VHE58_09640 [Burkholderiales bacterium]|nr:hypothetical protein [Burkholderiales bacterium]